MRATSTNSPDRPLGVRSLAVDDTVDAPRGRHYRAHTGAVTVRRQPTGGRLIALLSSATGARRGRHVLEDAEVGHRVRPDEFARTGAWRMPRQPAHRAFVTARYQHHGGELGATPSTGTSTTLAGPSIGFGAICRRPRPRWQQCRRRRVVSFLATSTPADALGLTIEHRYIILRACRDPRSRFPLPRCTSSSPCSRENCTATP